MPELRAKYLHPGDVGRIINYGPILGWVDGVITTVEHLEDGGIRVTTDDGVERVMYGDSLVWLSGVPAVLPSPESIVCMDYPNCDRPHAGGAGGVPVHPPAGSRISGDEPLVPDEAT